ncbi:MAG: hypothetical protein JW841_15740 [Deltaproteobacteria bacterium]|nr:hypothetical protein [Deltaproteobacteria bacterium]
MQFFRRIYFRIKSALTPIFLRWAALFGFIVGVYTCPCCGQPACPNVVLGTGLVAGIVAFVRRHILKRRKNIKSKHAQFSHEMHAYEIKDNEQI